MFPHIPKPSSKATSKHSIAMEPGGDSPPIWSPPSTLFVPVRRRSRLSSFLNPVTLTIAFSVLIFIIFFLLPPTLSRNNQALKPDSSVKKRWNSINILLVLFAVLCGVFARRNEESSSSDGAETVQTAYEFVNSGRPSVSGGFWLEYPDRKLYDKTSDYMNTGGNRLRRSSSSYPDLRRESLWGSDGEKLKYFDDFEVDFHLPPGNSHRHVRQTHDVEKDVVAETPVREIPVDKFELKNSVPPPPTQPITQVPQPPPPPVKRKRSVHSVPRQYNVERGGRKVEFNETRSSIPPPSKTPLPPSELKFHPLAERREKIQRKKSGTTNEIATAIVSLYQGTQTNRKKKVKSRDIFESVAQNPSPPTVPASSSIPPVPPPPPPPPSSKKVLQNFFRKSSKSKRVHSVSTAYPPPPPPPPPPPSSIFNSIFKTGSKSKRFQLTSASSPPPPPPPPPPPSSIFNSLFKNGTKSRHLKYIETQPPPPLPPTQRSRPKISPENTGKPPKPTKPSASHHESVVIAPASPLIHMPPPPPPPPPPFRMPEMKFIVKGDFVRIRSTDSSPGREDHDVVSVKSDCGDSIGPSFTCPSPDVDSKADTFISKRRDEWRLEKINYFNEPRNTGSWSAGLG
ncbi:uncharacterized protein [Primulina eburnea]|uniref:uncharacterized protein n=1 Tax=Primulina eburnea TaxID=1245227 RepID=UPI003C6C7767